MLGCLSKVIQIMATILLIIGILTLATTHLANIYGNPLVEEIIVDGLHVVADMVFPGIRTPSVLAAFESKIVWIVGMYCECYTVCGIIGFLPTIHCSCKIGVVCRTTNPTSSIIAACSANSIHTGLVPSIHNLIFIGFTSTPTTVLNLIHHLKHQPVFSIRKAGGNLRPERH